MIRHGIGGWRIPTGWTRAASGVYEHPQFGRIERIPKGKSMIEWRALPKNGKQARGSLANLRTAALECERLMMDG